MSRETLGRGREPPGRAGGPPSGASRVLRRAMSVTFARRRPPPWISRHAPVAVGAAALAVGLALGGLAPATDAGRIRPPAAVGPVATMLGASTYTGFLSPEPDAGGAVVEVSAQVQLVNDSAEAIALLGVGAAETAARLSSVHPVPVTVAPRRRVALRVQVIVDCASPRALRWPGLSVRQGGSDYDIPVFGAASEMVRLCRLVAPDQVLQVTGVRRDGDRLGIEIAVPSGRPVRLVALSAGGVELRGAPLPTTVRGGPSRVLLDRPDCSARWQSGIPRALDVTLADGDDPDGAVSRSHVRLDIGAPLATWLLDVSCVP